MVQQFFPVVFAIAIVLVIIYIRDITRRKAKSEVSERNRRIVLAVSAFAVGLGSSQVVWWGGLLELTKLLSLFRNKIHIVSTCWCAA